MKRLLSFSLIFLLLTPFGVSAQTMTAAQKATLIASLYAKVQQLEIQIQTLTVQQTSQVAQPTVEDFSFNGTTYNFLNLPADISTMPQNSNWTKMATSFGDVWINTANYSIPSYDICDDTYYPSFCPSGEVLMCSMSGSPYCESLQIEVADQAQKAFEDRETQCQEQVAQVEEQIASSTNYYTKLIAPLEQQMSNEGIALGEAGATQLRISQEIESDAEAEQFANEAFQQELVATQNDCNN